MKKTTLIIALITTVLTQSNFAQAGTSQSQLPQLLSLYYNTKDALVAGNAIVAASKADALAKVSTAIDYNLVSESNLKALVKEAGKISGSKDLKKQREYFVNLSNSMMVIAKAVKLSDNPIYQAYCPMEKASWLSNEKAIKNPYYGSSMLTCGEVTQTIE